MLIELAGQRFGRLKVVARAQNSASGTARWECICDCGGQTVVQGNHLRAGAIESCGCLQRETSARAQRRHGYAGTPTYVVWLQMVQRCSDPACKSFRDYGARGITVTPTWLKFENFLADMGERPQGMSIERDDVNGNYEPDNCRWATRIEQANNTRRNRFLTAYGRTQTAAQWGREFGISGNRILRRIDRGHWSVEKAITTP
jgi:hypothetical protein